MKTPIGPATNGYIAKLEFGSLPVFVHWTFPLTGVVLMLILGEFSITRFVPILSAYVLLILVHEVGHAAFVALARKKVHAITITGAGGWCVAERPETLHGTILYLAGGLLFQAFAFVVALFLLHIVGRYDSIWVSSFAFVFIFYNAFMFLINIMPVGNTDGAKLWSVIRQR